MKTNVKYSEADLIQGIINGYIEILTCVFNVYFPVISRFVRLNSGNPEDDKDVFQDSLLILYRKLGDPEFRLNCTLKTFFILGVAVHLV